MQSATTEGLQHYVYVLHGVLVSIIQDVGYFNWVCTLTASSTNGRLQGVNGLSTVIFATVFHQNFVSSLSQEVRHFIILKNKMHLHGMETLRFSTIRKIKVMRSSGKVMALLFWDCGDVAASCTTLICLLVIKLSVLYYLRKVFCFCLIMHSCTSPCQPITFAAFSVDDVQAFCIKPWSGT